MSFSKSKTDTMVATASGGVFGLQLGSVTQGDVVITSGTMLIKQIDDIAAIPPDSKCCIYFSALVLWSRFAGPDCMKFASDSRLPDFVRTTIAGFKKLHDW